MTSMNDIVSRVQTVPPLPGAVVRLIAIINDPASTVQDMVQVIQYDAGLTAQTLRLCNSAYFGLARRVTSLHEAIRFLGSLRLLQIVMSVQGTALLGRAQRGYGMEPGDLWLHSVAVALASASFGRRVHHPNEGLLFTGGLLHDIGKIVLNEFVAAEFTEILARVENEKLSFCEAEQQVLGFSHSDIGATLAERWELPPAIIRCIRYHHDPAELEKPDPDVDMVYLGELTCTMLGLGHGCDGLSYRAHDEVLHRYGLREVDFERIGMETTLEVGRVRQMFADAGGPAASDHRSTAAAEVW